MANPAPNEILNPDGHPRFGAYLGAPHLIDFRGLASPYSRGALGTLMRRKRWMYVFVATDEVLVAAAVVDAGPTATTFLMAVDRQNGSVVADVSRPGAVRPLVGVNDNPREGHASHYRGPGTRVSILGSPGALRMRARYRRLPHVPLVGQPWVELDVALNETTQLPLTVVSDLRADPPLASTTVKNGALPTEGSLVVRNRRGQTRWSLEGAAGGYDYTNGYLPRHTSWNWAFGAGKTADGRGLALNLVANFSGLEGRGTENCVWLDGRLVLLDPDAVIECSGDASSEWKVRTSDGKVDLTFTPDAAHHERLNLVLLRSKFIQALGQFHGRVEVDGEVLDIVGLAGAVEDQDVLW